MTAKEAIEILSDVGDINRCCAEDAEALDMSIKALEQQPILDKIRAEIEQIEIKGCIRDVECFNAGINTVLNIIDKHMGRKRG